jgi:hypothetical protein
VVLILAVLAAPGRCSAAAWLRVGMGMATRHPGVWQWRVEPCYRAQEINATTCHTGCRQSRDHGRVRLIAQAATQAPVAKRFPGTADACPFSHLPLCDCVTKWLNGKSSS